MNFLLKLYNVQHSKSYKFEVDSLTRVTSNIVYNLCAPTPIDTDLNKFRVYLDLQNSTLYSSRLPVTESRDSLYKAAESVSTSVGSNPEVLFHQLLHLSPLYNNKNGGKLYCGVCTS